MYRYNVPDQEAYDTYSEMYDEVIKMYGVDVKYIPSTNTNETLYTGEWKDKIFNNCVDMIMRIVGIEDLGNNDMYTKFGYSSPDMLTFYCSKLQFDDVGVNPKNGDLIYIPYYNHKIFQITDVDQETENWKFNFQSLSNNKVGFKLTGKLYNPDMIDEYNTNETEVDALSGLNIATSDRMTDEVEDKITNDDILDTSETDPLGDV